MNRSATGLQEPQQDAAPCPPLPADHVLSSGAVLFPGVFDQHGCPLFMFPADGQARLLELSSAEVVDFITYFRCLHNKKQEKQSSPSVVADLRNASPPAARFIAETLLQLEQPPNQRLHSVYIIQPTKKEVLKLLLKLLAPSKTHSPSFRKILLKELQELSNYIDRSQLPVSLGGYLRYCHQSWVSFIKEIDSFVQEFVSVVQRLPSCISTLQAMSRLQPPSTLKDLQHFCYTNEAKFLQLRRDLGLDELLRHCEGVVEKLHLPDLDPCYQDMVGTTLFTQTAFDMLQNHSRITAAVEKVELLWQQAFSKAHLQLQVVQLRSDALEMTEKIERLQEKLQPYKLEIAEDGVKAETLLSEFKGSIHTPAVALVRCAEDLIHTVAEVLPLEARSRESWVLDLERLKDNLHSSVHYIHQTLRAVHSYHLHHSKVSSWYHLVLCENFLQELLSGVYKDPASSRRASIPAWRQRLARFLKKNPPPDMEVLLHLAHVSNAIPDPEIQQAGRQISQRCMTLRKLLISSGPVPVEQLQLALQWQYDLLRSSRVKPSSDSDTVEELQHSSSEPELRGGGLPSLGSFDSGFGQLEAPVGRGGMDGIGEAVSPGRRQPQIQEEICSVSDCDPEELGFGSVGNSSRASIRAPPKGQADAVNFEIKVKRSAAPPTNPWLSLPVDDLEDSYTVTITPNPTPQRTGSHDASELHAASTQTESRSSVEDPEVGRTGIPSSTIAEGGDERSTEDSYDLHGQKADAASRMDFSQDWDVKEQEGLQEVEKLLEKTNEILEEEENVLAIQAVLDSLMWTENDEFTLLDREDPLSETSSSELPEDSDGSFELESEDSAAESSAAEAAGQTAEGSSLCRLDLLTELRDVHVLDELIMEESEKIHKLRHCEDLNRHPSGPPVPEENSASRRREAFRLQLEKERKEVEKLEESLDKEQEMNEEGRSEAKNSCSHQNDFQDQTSLPSGLTEPKEDPQTSPNQNPGGSEADPSVCGEPALNRRPDDAAFDPGGRPPAAAEQEPPEVLDPASCSAAEEPGPSQRGDGSPDLSGQLLLTPKEHPNKNNNNNMILKNSENSPKSTSEDEDDPSERLLLHVDQRSTKNVQSTQETRPEQLLEFDPHGRPEQMETLGLHSSERMRTSSCGSQEMQHLHDNVRDMAQFETPIVLDTGSGLMKAGFADQDLPNVTFPTIIGIPKYEEIMNGNLQRETYVGQEAQNMRGVLALKRPIKNGTVQNWDDMEKIWEHTFLALRVEPDNHPVLLTEAAMNPLDNRQRMVQIMFELFNVPFTYVALQAVLGLYAAGRTTGLVFDSGDGVSHSVPVFEGYCLPHAVQRFPLAGLDVTTHLKKLLQEQGVAMRTSAEEEIVREMKEKCCCVALHYETELSGRSQTCKEMHYTMPDGQVVTVGSARFRAPEILFKPELIGRDHYGMHESIFKSIMRSDIDLRRSFLENIVLSGNQKTLPEFRLSFLFSIAHVVVVLGGNTLLPGLPERLQAEVSGLVPADMAVKVRVTSLKDRDFLVWSGGAVLANSPSFSSAWISQEEYEEYGPQIVFRKCF
ncbi:uncharacterized protein LOC112157760 isoform X3 [Oryzias melastigma]|uniref:uncharacterized protein LOC112157760 isoform X3 n=1 Tax=Oryzias melastigma TaxID=30732 RepID=UPI00168CF8DA|nr:uncharacterized protein LOC112157760 isoform X3 [Oryzias melastigma]